MGITRERIEDLAQRLMAAEANREPIAPLTETVEGLTVDDAYQVQLCVLRDRLAAGLKVVGKKVGLTSVAMQQMFGVDQPDYGMVLDTMLIEDGAQFPCSQLLQPRVEPEIAFMLKADLKGPSVTAEEVLAATAYVFPALEVIDSRIRDWKIKLADTIADNASAARVVVGTSRVPVQGLDLANEELVFERNGEELGRARGEAVLGNPANAVAWVANKLSEYGITIKANEFVIPGALMGATAVKAGDVVRARFSHVGSVSVRFV